MYSMEIHLFGQTLRVEVIVACVILGYILGIAGIASLALSFEAVKKALAIPLPPALNSTILTIAGIVLAVVGMLIVAKSSKADQPAEVPIYHGKNVVGFRRMGK